MMPPRKPGQGVTNPNDPQLYRERCIKGAKTAKARASVYMVEGEAVTYVQMAERVGCTLDAIRRRHLNARRMGPPTWAELTRAPA